VIAWTLGAASGRPFTTLRRIGSRPAEEENVRDRRRACVGG
jgi:hypothetical protein